MGKNISAESQNQDPYRIFPPGCGCPCEPAMGHQYDPHKVRCMCGKTWSKQQESPTICPLVAKEIRRWLSNPLNKEAYEVAQSRGQKRRKAMEAVHSRALERSEGRND